MEKVSVEAMELSFKVLETILVYKEYKSKEEVMKVAETMKNVALENSKYPKTVKEAAPKAEAEDIKAKLEAAGAKVELK